MKTIFLINDNSAHAKHAAELAYSIACKVQANILIGNIVKTGRVVSVKEKTLIGGNIETTVETTPDLRKHLQNLHTEADSFKPIIGNFNLADLSESDISQLINKYNIWMVVKGTPAKHPLRSESHSANINFVLNKIKCPVLLVPENSEVNNFERMIYMADLRYCQLHVVRFLTEMADPFGANVMVAHLSAKELPNMDREYSHSVFKETICRSVRYDKLFFDNIQERDVRKAVDILINGMSTDLMALVNHQFHFEEVVNGQIEDTLPPYINIPLLIFPN
ncbi:universal stress protein [Arcticibacter tournemirensis]|uniref:Universal stress protein n=1 Tax=Arcticibacter tournemirensis TaxID=699437 RepID=A0A4Q0MBW1_9SPHI|nr:universal stress protein [Arcticibacter tournemirensis]RXF70655.1 universal stress protein [Arcticibacter tournemirensis]